MEFIGLIKKLGLFALGLYMPMNTAFAVTFSDVPIYHKNYQSVASLSSAGVIGGYTDGSFKPEKTISRAEAVKILVASKFSSDSTNNCLTQYAQADWSYVFFGDVPNDTTWFTKYICTAKANNIISGYTDGTFRPNNTVNFAEGLKMILESFNTDTSRSRFQQNSLLYVNSDDWFARYFTYAYNANLINRMKFYHPAQAMTRGDFTEIIYRLQNIQANSLSTFQELSQPQSNEYTITVPRLNIINLNVSFADIYDAQGALDTLKSGLGHYLNPPGSGKKMVIFGHSSGYSWDSSSYKYILKEINKIQDGDTIYINYQEKGYVYQVSSKEILPANKLNVILTDSGTEELAMYTCWPPNSISQRYVVYATRI